MSTEYLFGPLERRGVFLGARLGQIVVVLVATGLVVGILTASPSPLGAALALCTLAGGGVAILVPFAGRTIEEWTPVLAGFLFARVTAAHRWISPGNLRGHRLLPIGAWTGHEVVDPHPRTQRTPSLHVVRGSDHGRGPDEPDPARNAPADRLVRDVRRADGDAPAPPYLRGIRLLAVRWRDGEVGVLADARTRTYTAVIAVGGSSPALADGDGKERRLSQWGAVLAGVARDGGRAVTRVQWIERSAPNDSEAAVHHLQQHRVLELSNPFVRSYLSLLDEQGAQTQQHEVLVAIQVSAARASATIRRLRAGVDVGACEVLSEELLALAQSLRQADIEVRGVLSPRMLAATLRRAADPTARDQLAHRAAADPDSAGACPRSALPRASLTTWSTFQTEGGHHATYWVAEWPRTAVDTDWMSPLLLGTRCRRTVAAVMEPSPPGRALRRVEAARVDDETTASFRQRFGFRRTVRRQREAENVARAEEELNEGHQHIALSAYITVTATTTAELAAGCQEVEQQAGMSRLDLRREYGTQDAAFTYTLPLCRGLR